MNTKSVSYTHLSQQRARIGAYGKETAVAHMEHAAVAHNQIQADAQQAVNRYQLSLCLATSWPIMSLKLNTG